MSKDFQRALAFVLGREGGFVDDSHDPGGATNFGITLKTLSEWRGTECTADDVRNMRRDEAAAIYEKHYWQPICGDFLPWPLNVGTFDAAVNSGVKQASKWLQAAVGVVADGEVGAQTILAAKNAPLPAAFNDMLNVRLGFLKDLNGWKYYGKGWDERIEALRALA